MSGPSNFHSLYVKILLIPVIAFVLGGLIPGFLAYRLLMNGADREAREKAENMLATLEVRRPEPELRPMAVTSDGSRVHLAVLDARTPEMRADSLEARLIAAFDADRNLRRSSEEVVWEGRPVLISAAPIEASRFGKNTHAGWKPGQVVAAWVVSTPLDGMRDRAAMIFWIPFKVVALLSLLCLGLLAWRTHKTIIQPAQELLETSRAIRRGEWGANFSLNHPDEMQALALSFQDTTFWLREQIAKEEKLRALFQQFIPASVAARALGRKAEDILAGTRHPVTVMIINIRNFKLLMEHLPPEQTVSTLNEYFSQVNQVIVANKGIVSKYLGDTVLAFFGMPLGDEEHTLNAVRAALVLPQALQDLYVRLDEQYGWELGVGIGITTGEPIVGHFGSSEHMEYTVLGDVVREAHRLEEITKSVPEEDTILISEATYRQIMSDVHVFDMGERTVSGGATIHAYAVQGFRSEARNVIAA